MAIGAPGETFYTDFTGRVHIYVNQSGVWTQMGQDIDGEAADDLSGHSVSLSSDGCNVAIGAPGNDDNGDLSGHVRVYKLSDVKLSTEKIETGIYTLYPNPTNSKFAIELSNTATLENVNIYDNLGKLVLTSKETNVDISELALEYIP